MINQICQQKTAYARPENPLELGFSDCAKELIAKGVPVFPCKVNKAPLVQGGFKAASLDPMQIESWAQQWPNALVGVPTGARSGFFVLDIDRKKDKDGFKTLVENGWELPETRTHTTKSGGAHCLFKYQVDLGLKNSVEKLGYGLDIRTDGGYIIWWPALGQSVKNADILEDVPPWLIKALQVQVTNAPVVTGFSEAVAEGRRNESMFLLAASLRGKGLSEKSIEAALLDVNQRKCQPPLAVSEIKTIVKSVSKYPEGPINGQTRDLTELGNAGRLLDLYSDTVRYIPGIKSWLIWQNDCWQWDTDGAKVCSLAGELHWQIYAEGQQAPDFDLRKAINRWAVNSQSRKIIDNSTHLLSRNDHIRLPLSRIDSSLFLVGLAGSKLVIDLKSGEVRSAEPSDLITKSLGVDLLGDSSQALRWKAFLSQIFNDDSDLIGWLQRWCGYLLTGSTQEQILLFCFGLGCNGKSVFAETLRSILGDYARTLNAECLCDTNRQAGSANPELFSLIGARLALTSETEDGAALAESLIKTITGGDTVTTRPLYGSPVNFLPAFKLMMLGNHKPIVRGGGHSLWRRMRLVPFNRVFKPDERDPLLLNKLKEEAPHILAWMVEGCMKWRKQGLSVLPAAIRQATESYQSEQDLIGQWIEECCIQGKALESTSSALYESYKGWCAVNGLKPSSHVAFGRRFKERGFGSRKAHGQPVYAGICLTNDVGDLW
jgi:P4 family phage/plasmid primase-like protien